MTNRHILLTLLFALLVSCTAAEAQVRHEVGFPDICEYETLVCDFHMHSVFSDGNVWPSVRVDEAFRQGLDAIALTDHIEYQPHKDDIPTNHNRPYALVAGSARVHGILCPKAAEITRDTPPGHFNAMFLSDVEKLDTPDFVEAIKQANEQEAFVFWNHQAWKGEEKGRWLDVHTTIYEKGWLHGMEVCNGRGYHPSAHKWCLEKNLTMLGNSDIHGPDLRKKSTPDDHRTLTLVFAKEKTLDSLKEALHEGRTAVWFGEELIGRKQWLAPLFKQCVEVEKPHLRSDKNVWVKIRNKADIDIKLARTGKVGPSQLTLPARTTLLVKLSTTKTRETLELAYTATNFRITPEDGLPVVLHVDGP